MASARKTAIVTGGSQGIGAGLVKAFLEHGYSVVATSRNITTSGAFEASDKLALVDGNGFGHSDWAQCHTTVKAKDYAFTGYPRR